MQLALDTSLLTTREAAQLLGYTHDYIARMCRAREIQAVREGTQWLIDPAEAQRFAKMHAARLAATRTKLSEVRRSERSRSGATEIAVPYPYAATLPSSYRAEREEKRTRVIDEVVAVSIALLVASGSATIAGSGIIEASLLRPVADTARSAAAGARFILEDAYDSLKATPAIADGRDFKPLYAEYGASFSVPEISYARDSGPFIFDFAFANTSYFATLPLDTKSSRAVITLDGVGEAGLSAGVLARDTARRIPAALLRGAIGLGATLAATSEAIMDTYEDAIYAFAALPEPLARGTIDGLSAIGERTQKAIDRAPTYAVRAYDRTARALAEAGPQAARPIVAGEIAIGTFLAESSHKVARGSYAALFASLDALEALPERVNAYTPDTELRYARIVVADALESLEVQRGTLIASLHGTTKDIRAEVGAAMGPFIDADIGESMRAAAYTAGESVLESIENLLN